eukprot:1793315-Amphidinium_carterae.6
MRGRRTSSKSSRSHSRMNKPLRSQLDSSCWSATLHMEIGVDGAAEVWDYGQRPSYAGGFGDGHGVLLPARSPRHLAGGGDWPI